MFKETANHCIPKANMPTRICSIKPSTCILNKIWHKTFYARKSFSPLQTLLTTETAGIKDEEGRTVLLTAAELGKCSFYH